MIVFTTSSMPNNKPRHKGVSPTLAVSFQSIPGISAKNFVDEALSKSESFKDKSDDELSVLQKLIKKCGKNSQIPLGK